MIDLRPYRDKLFPDVTDFSDPMDHMRNADGKDLTPAEIVWYKPEFYQDFARWFSIGLTVFLFGIAVISFINSEIVLGVIWGIVTFFQFKSARKIIKNLEYQQDLNLWDLCIRDISVQGNKVKGKYQK